MDVDFNVFGPNAGPSATVQTDANGQYRLVLSPGYQTITETDPSGYMSTTPNTLNVDVIPGAVSTRRALPS